MNIQVGVKAIIQNSDGSYLFLKRTSLVSTDNQQVSWDIPGGRIDPGELLIDALRREIKEEIGHDLQSEPRLIAAQDIIVSAKDLHVVRLTYLIEENVPTITLSDEHDDFRWIGADESGSVTMEPYLAQVFNSIK